ncbi:tetratricopeptide repeat protein [Luteimonas sp. 3794]|uniref:tetratricopeptide repeat protein n=1 Tax=Luteimonas sp. 3794 TaxID=2817730 RepID=UPI0028624C31|nr:tetratricopeptide repeat protein [Luteimonas sp. 3794]MDR6990016.1 lipopolysaccharide biosynthesis regulator YciM [Luteimonas sp. 3794]
MSQQIYQALRRGANAEAATLARQALAEGHKDTGTLSAAALAFRAIGERETALSTIDAAIAQMPDDAELHFLRAGMLLDTRDLGGAQAALAQTIALDPNQYGAYVVQAQMAIGRNDLDEAERQTKLAARVAPEHPWTLMLEGVLASRRGDHDRALTLLSAASKDAPEDVQVISALGFAYLAKGHLAFAEQAFRRLIEKTGEVQLHGLLAQIVLQQGRPAEAADALAVLLADPAHATPSLQAFAGELELQAKRFDRAKPLLQAAFTAHPDSRRATNGLLLLWEATGNTEETQAMLDGALEQDAQWDHVWIARLAMEAFGSEAAATVVSRWNTARPDHLPALQAQLALESGTGAHEASEVTARRITSLQPGHGNANELLFNRLLARDPAAAVTFVEGLLPAASPQARLMLRRWVGMAQDAADRPADAIATWLASTAEETAQVGPPPAPTTPPARWPEMGTVVEGARAPAVFLYGAPGAQVDRIANVLQRALPEFRGDRFSTAVQDPFQDTNVPARLAQGEFTAEQVAAGWLSQLPARGIGPNGAVIDWIPFWDNAWLLALRPQLPHARLLLALRDPRDMLLEWFAFGAPMALRVTDANSAAQWLAAHLSQIADIIEQDLFPHTVVRTDAPGEDLERLATRFAEALGVPAFPTPPRELLGPDRIPAGRWLAYREALAGPFATLTPVAVRLGYRQD